MFIKTSGNTWMCTYVYLRCSTVAVVKNLTRLGKNITPIILSKSKHSFSKIGKAIIFLFGICSCCLNFVYIT